MKDISKCTIKLTHISGISHVALRFDILCKGVQSNRQRVQRCVTRAARSEKSLGPPSFLMAGPTHSREARGRRRRAAVHRTNTYASRSGTKDHSALADTPAATSRQPPA